jgi:hypothetical protein
LLPAGRGQAPLAAVGALVDLFDRKIVEQPVGHLLLIERLLQQSDDILVATGPRLGDRRAVAGNTLLPGSVL